MVFKQQYQKVISFFVRLENCIGIGRKTDVVSLELQHKLREYKKELLDPNHPRQEITLIHCVVHLAKFQLNIVNHVVNIRLTQGLYLLLMHVAFDAGNLSKGLVVVGQRIRDEFQKATLLPVHDC